MRIKKRNFRLNPDKRQYREHYEQSAFIEWMGLQYPKIVCFGIPNAGKRTFQEALRLQKEGLLSGVPDVFIAFPSMGFHGLFIEFKWGKKKLSAKQSVILEKLNNSGYIGKTVYSMEEGRTEVNNYIKQLDTKSKS